MKPKTLKEALKERLSKEELSYLQRAFDTVGDIAIIEIPEELKDKDELIGKTLLKIHKNINVVCKKEGIHKGTYRTQKLKVIAGEDRKETIHKENGIFLKLDVEKVYYSTRSGTERKRVASQVNKGEDILVMFSGCGPFVSVLAKNTSAKFVYGVELNPIAHKYAAANIRANKISNALVIEGDVRKKIPDFYKCMIGLKTALVRDQLHSRMKHEPDIIELHTFSKDFGSGFSKLKSTIKKLIKEGKEVVVHQPISDARDLVLINYSIVHPIYKKLIELVKEFRIRVVIHINNSLDEGDRQTAIENAKTFKRHYPFIYFEHSDSGKFKKVEEILNFADKSEAKNLCIDLCHLLYNYKPNEIPKLINKIQKKYNTYFHVADFKNDVHGSKLYGSPNLDLEKTLPLITMGVTEIISKDEDTGKEMIKSWKSLSGFEKKFDRILMPLPKSAEDFLDIAINALKKKGILHFYDFLEEDEFYIAHDKIKKACKKLKRKVEIKNTVKCGQFGPRIYRICVDAEVF